MLANHEGSSGAEGSEDSPFTEPEWERVGQTLRSFRETRGFTPSELAQEMEISRSYLVRIELGQKRLTNVLLARAAKALGIPQKAIMLPESAENVA